MIDIYAELKPKLGTHAIKNMKRLWELIAEKMNGPVTPAQCENKWRVLERAYKKYIDNQKSTGSGRKFFEYAEEMDLIFKGKKNVQPILLLSDTTKDDIPNLVEDDLDSVSETDLIKPSSSKKVEPEVKQKETPFRIKHNRTRQRSNPVLNRNITLEKMRQDRKEYYNARIEQETEKVNLLKQRNALLSEKNQILKNKICSLSLNRPNLE